MLGTLATGVGTLATGLKITLSTQLLRSVTDKEKTLRRAWTLDSRVHPDVPSEDGPFGHYCADNAQIWKLYMDRAKIFDDNLANLFNSDLDPLLIFAGLFSAILSAFLIEIRKGLQEDLQTITNNLLMTLIENQRNIVRC
ncbi:hypothetical protein MVEN_01646500 [Mycena venus]|uniref:DUF6535 domain-containing protein n=1 Tax=Mycena venus TaxID=2733690 RepID=A0A8H7CRI5_9AGAR|nr:hypothetical protein MVEN_01646500 [Mycena venus]